MYYLKMVFLLANEGFVRVGEVKTFVCVDSVTGQWSRRSKQIDFKSR